MPIAPSPLRRRWAIAFGLYTVATNISFTQAVWVLYLAAHHYSPLAIGLFETAFHLAKFVAEVPTGIFADLRGRRASLVASCAVGAPASLLFLHPTAAMIALSFALQGVSYAFRGGADSALLWTLAARSGAPDRAATYSRLFSRMLLVTIFAQTVGTASGGFLGGIFSTLPFLCSAAAIAAGIPPLLLLPEQRLARAHRPHPLAHLRQGLHAVAGDPVLLGLLLLSGLTASVFTTIGYYTQLYFASLGFSLAAVGVIIAVCVVPDSLGAALAPRLLRHLPRRVVLAACIALECLGVLCLGIGSPALALIGFVVLLHSGDSVLYPALNTYLNERSPEPQRATVLSLDTGVFSAAMIVLFPLFGLGLTHIEYTVAYRWTLVALTAGIAAIVAFVALLRTRRASREGE
ncbi:MAG: MFS transporter [Ktedonobacterales bacterium]